LDRSGADIYFITYFVGLHIKKLTAIERCIARTGSLLLDQLPFTGTRERAGIAAGSLI
jgi:hypothetical protein